MESPIFKVELNLGNAAFGSTRQSQALEVARILKRVADNLIEEATDYPYLWDHNGNHVGSAMFKSRRLR